MSRLRRLRSWWLSLYLPRRPASQTARHRDLFKSQEDYYEWRNRLQVGCPERYVFTDTKALGTQTLATGTTEGCSSYSRPGEVSEDEAGLTLYRLPSSFTGPSLSGDGTVGLGGSGAPLDSAG